MSTPAISSALTEIRSQIRAAEIKWHRSENSVTLLAVTKKKSVIEIREAMSCGQVDFGENYVDEAVKKIHQLQDDGCCWHFIGSIQSNKTKLIAKHFSWVHSIDRLKIAQRLSEQRPVDLPPLNCCIQVNIDGESTKAGIAPDALLALGNAILALPGIRLRGLMVIPATQTEFHQQRAVFSRVRTLYEQHCEYWPDMDTLSMGMSGDMLAAIAEGSTMVRIGTAIFGEREA